MFISGSPNVESDMITAKSPVETFVMQANFWKH